MKIQMVLLVALCMATSAFAEPETATLRDQAERGDSEAQYLLGNIYDQTMHDGPEAMLWYEKAAQQGHAQAMERLCHFYIKDYNQIKRGLAWCQKAADKDVPFGLAAVGGALALGVGGLEIDGPKALDYLTRADAAGSIDGTTQLADLYSEGKIVPQDYQRSAALYRKAMAKGSSIGASSLARQYELGLGVPVEPNEAARLYFLSSSWSVSRTWLDKHPEVNEETLSANQIVWVYPGALPQVSAPGNSVDQSLDGDARNYFFAKISEIYSKLFLEEDIIVKVVVDCHWNTAGDLDNCVPFYESPLGRGVADVTINLATTPFLLNDKSAWASKVAGKSARLAIRWTY
jgi:hypothetical protein